LFWIEPNTKKVIGCAPNRFQNLKKEMEEIEGNERNLEKTIPGFLHSGDGIGTID